MKKADTSLGKALRLLFAVGESSDPAGISVVELVQKTGLSRPTIYRFLGELQEFGLVRPAPKLPVWQLGSKVVALAAMAGNWAALRRQARRAMEEFVSEVGYTVHLGIRDGTEVVYIDRAESPKYPTIASVIGQRRALNVTALGKCLVAFDANKELAVAIADAGLTGRTKRSISNKKTWLAEIAKVRNAGIAYDIEECDEGARCVAAPITDAEGHAVAAVSISALATSATDINFIDMTREIKRLAMKISMPVS